jgi:hypothetical protein
MPARNAVSKRARNNIPAKVFEKRVTVVKDRGSLIILKIVSFI